MLFNFLLGRRRCCPFERAEKTGRRKKGALITMFLILCSFAAILGFGQDILC